MSKSNGQGLGIALCEAFGIDTTMVRSLNLRIDVREPAVLTVERIVVDTGADIVDGIKAEASRYYLCEDTPKQGGQA